MFYLSFRLLLERDFSFVQHYFFELTIYTQSYVLVLAIYAIYLARDLVPSWLTRDYVLTISFVMLYIVERVLTRTLLVSRRYMETIFGNDYKQKHNVSTVSVQITIRCTFYTDDLSNSQCTALGGYIGPGSQPSHNEKRRSRRRITWEPRKCVAKKKQWKPDRNSHGIGIGAG